MMLILYDYWFLENINFSDLLSSNYFMLIKKRITKNYQKNKNMLAFGLD